MIIQQTLRITNSLIHSLSQLRLNGSTKYTNTNRNIWFAAVPAKAGSVHVISRFFRQHHYGARAEPIRECTQYLYTPGDLFEVFSSVHNCQRRDLQKDRWRLTKTSTIQQLKTGAVRTRCKLDPAQFRRVAIRDQRAPHPSLLRFSSSDHFSCAIYLCATDSVARSPLLKAWQLVASACGRTILL